LNGYEPVATEEDYYRVIMALASGQMSKEQLAAWLETVTQQL
jgi:prophage maintenance system killer protein